LESRRELGPVYGLAEDAGAWRLWRRAAVVVRVVPSASARSIASRLGLVPVTPSGLEGGPDVHVGPDTFVDRWGPVTPLRVRGRQTLHRWCLVWRGSVPLASRVVGL